MSMRLRTNAVVCLMGALALAGCDTTSSDEAPTPSTTTTAVPSTTSESAVAPAQPFTEPSEAGAPEPEPVVPEFQPTGSESGGGEYSGGGAAEAPAPEAPAPRAPAPAAPELPEPGFEPRPGY